MDKEAKPCVPVATATFVTSATPAICIGTMLTNPFASETAVVVDAASTGAIGHGPRAGHAISAASTV